MIKLGSKEELNEKQIEIQKCQSIMAQLYKQQTEFEKTKNNMKWKLYARKRIITFEREGYVSNSTVISMSEQKKGKLLEEKVAWSRQRDSLMKDNAALEQKNMSLIDQLNKLHIEAPK